MTWRLSWVQQGEVHLRDYDKEADARSGALILQMHCSKACRCIAVDEVDAVPLGPMPEADRIPEKPQKRRFRKISKLRIFWPK